MSAVTTLAFWLSPGLLTAAFVGTFTDPWMALWLGMGVTGGWGIFLSLVVDP